MGAWTRSGASSGTYQLDFFEKALAVVGLTSLLATFLQTRESKTSASPET